MIPFPCYPTEVVGNMALCALQQSLGAFRYLSLPLHNPLGMPSGARYFIMARQAWPPGVIRGARFVSESTFSIRDASWTGDARSRNFQAGRFFS